LGNIGVEQHCLGRSGEYLSVMIRKRGVTDEYWVVSSRPATFLKHSFDLIFLFEKERLYSLEDTAVLS
jgi:hypothetical protein